MSFLTKLHEAEAEIAAQTAIRGGCRWSVCAAKLATMASSELARRRCSITWRSPAQSRSRGMSSSGEADG